MQLQVAKCAFLSGLFAGVDALNLYLQRSDVHVDEPVFESVPGLEKSFELSKSRRADIEGGFGHYRDAKWDQKNVLVKVYSAQHQNVFDKEVSVLRRLKDVNYPWVVKYVADFDAETAAEEGEGEAAQDAKAEPKLFIVLHAHHFPWRHNPTTLEQRLLQEGCCAPAVPPNRHRRREHAR